MFFSCNPQIYIFLSLDLALLSRSFPNPTARSLRALTSPAPCGLPQPRMSLPAAPTPAQALPGALFSGSAADPALLVTTELQALPPLDRSLAP